MKKPAVSDFNDFKDLDAILKVQFQCDSLAKQPRYLIEIGCENGSVLKHAFSYIKSKTSRGKRLSDYPLVVIALTLDQSKNGEIAKELMGIPHMIASISEKKISVILKSLENLGVEGARLGLYLDFISEGQTLDFHDFASLNSRYGLIQFHETDKCGQHLLEAAKFGLFPKIGMSYCYYKSTSHKTYLLNHFENRPYTVRTSIPKDIPDLLQIAGNLTKAQLVKRMNDYPHGQLVLETSAGIIGFLSALHLSSSDALVAEEHLDDLHDPQGSTVHLATFSVLPQNNLLLEEQFLEFFLQKTLSESMVNHVSCVLECQNYPGKDVISMESYVEELKQEKGSADLATRLHSRHGAEIKKCIPKYRPQDVKNLGNGVLVVYSRGKRTPVIRNDFKETLTFEKEYTAESIEKSFENIIQRFLLESKKSLAVSYSKSSSFTHMGLDYLQLLELRSLLSEEFSMDLPSNFFVQYETAAAVINFFIDAKLQIYRDWFYKPQWQSTPKPQIETLPLNKNWLIVADLECSIVAPVCELLHEYGQKCIIVPSGSSISNLEDLEGVIYFTGAAEDKDLEKNLRSNIEGLVLLANQMAEKFVKKIPKLWVVTQSIAEDGNLTSLAEWPVNALCKIIREEYPQFQCCFVAVDAQESPLDAAEILFNEIRNRSKEPQVAFRKGERLVLRMVRSAVEAIRIPKFSPKASYLIAGGFRPLGILLAQWYAAHGAKHIILLDEIELTLDMKAIVTDLQKRGIEINLCKTSLDDSVEIEKALHPAFPLKGIIQAAGIIDNDLLMHMDWERFKSVHRLKVSISWILHNLTQDLDLDHFVLFSSCLADIAPLAKANHATGNSFLDALSYYRQKQGLHSLTIDWGPWELRHMQVRHLMETSVSDHIKMLRVEDGFRILDHLFSSADPQITAAEVNWPVVLQSMAETNPFFDEIAIEMGYKRVEFLTKYMQSDQKERLRILQEYLHERIRKILKLKSSHQLEITRDFKKMGMDTAKMMALKNLIQFDLKEAMKLPFNFVETHPTIEKLSEALNESLEEGVLEKPITFKTVSRQEILSEKLLEELSDTLKMGKPLPIIIIEEQDLIGTF